MAKGENKVRELSLFQPCNQLLEVILRKFSRIFFKNHLCGLGRTGVEQHDSRYIFTERFRDAGELLGQHPHADARVVGRKAEFHEVAGETFYVFRGHAVV